MQEIFICNNIHYIFFNLCLNVLMFMYEEKLNIYTYKYAFIIIF